MDPRFGAMGGGLGQPGMGMNQPGMAMNQPGMGMGIGMGMGMNPQAAGQLGGSQLGGGLLGGSLLGGGLGGGMGLQGGIGLQGGALGGGLGVQSVGLGSNGQPLAPMGGNNMGMGGLGAMSVGIGANGQPMGLGGGMGGATGSMPPQSVGIGLNGQPMGLGGGMGGMPPQSVGIGLNGQPLAPVGQTMGLGGMPGLGMAGRQPYSGMATPMAPPQPTGGNFAQQGVGGYVSGQITSVDIRKLEQDKQALLRMQTESVKNEDVELSALMQELSRLENANKNSGIETQKLTAEMHALQKATGQRVKGVDLVFVSDCTFSMGPWLTEMKNKVKEIVAATQAKEPGIHVRVGFVGYRDYPKGKTKPGDNNMVVFELNEDVDKFQSFLATVKEDNGHDYPEDVAGGLNRALSLTWKYNTRVLVHIGDAPPHGSQYNTGNYDDNYPGGDPNGLVCETILKKLAENRVDYYFARISEWTVKMEASFKAALESVKKKWVPLELGTDTSQFLPQVVQSVSASVRAGGGFNM